MSKPFDSNSSVLHGIIQRLDLKVERLGRSLDNLRSENMALKRELTEATVTRKDYVAIAKVINFNRPRREIDFNYEEEVSYESRIMTCDDIAVDLCDIFKADNPNFDRVRFLEACKERM